MNKKSTTKVTPVEESPFGVYVWKVNGEFGGLLCNEDGDFLSITSEKGDLKRLAELRKAAAYYGYPDGEPVFFSGRRQVTDEEYREQKDRLAAGLTPDPYDVGALMDELREQKQNG